MAKLSIIRRLNALLRAYRETGNYKFLARAKVLELKLAGNN